MHVSGKKLAFSGILMALTVVLMVLSGVLQFNTLFLLGAASFAVGIMIREYGLKLGFAFYIGSVLLGLILAPDKFHCITFAVMGCYVLVSEFAWIKIGKVCPNEKGKKIFWIVKYVVFNLLYLPMLFLVPQLLFAGEIKDSVLIGAVVLGQVILFIYDKAYMYFQGSVWGSFRKRVGFDSFKNS